MIVYHGSFTEVRIPNLSFSREATDFGKGFYVTPIYEQAKSWAMRFKEKTGISFVSQYEFHQDEIINTKIFEYYDEGWVDFIVKCRTKQIVQEWDVVIGGVANDKVFNTIELFLDNLIDKATALQRLRYEEPNVQICIKTQETLKKNLTFLKSEVL